MSYLPNSIICILITKPSFNTDALDFILAASNVSDNIIVLFTGNGLSEIAKFYKPLQGFGITTIYASHSNSFNIKVISPNEIAHHVTHSQYTFSF